MPALIVGTLCYPDVSDSTAQANTLDDRYLMLNSGNDPITGGLNITGAMLVSGRAILLKT